MPQPNRPAPPPLATPPAPAQAPNTGQVSAGRQEIERLAGKPASDYMKPGGEVPLPADWESRLPKEWRDAITREAAAFKVPRELLARILWKESSFNEKAREGTSAQGQGIAGPSDNAMQDLVNHARDAALRDPENGARWGALEEAVGRRLGNGRMQAAPATRMAAEYLRYLYDTKGHSWPMAVASYAKGPTIISKYARGQVTSAAVPNWGELQAYLGLVFDGNAKRFDSQ